MQIIVGVQGEMSDSYKSEVSLAIGAVVLESSSSDGYFTDDHSLSATSNSPNITTSEISAFVMPTNADPDDNIDLGGGLSIGSSLPSGINSASDLDSAPVGDLSICVKSGLIAAKYGSSTYTAAEQVSVDGGVQADAQRLD